MKELGRHPRFWGLDNLLRTKGMASSRGFSTPGRAIQEQDREDKGGESLEMTVDADTKAQNRASVPKSPQLLCGFWCCGVEVQIQFDDIHSWFAEEAELTSIGVLRD
jgi:hypothetical protein